uniref:subtilisin n=1 Tax=Albugo laibachii Nc14 TaxID=890382 RepID=F0WRU9_9STRA|nr:serine protease family S08A putative [Albugo laibachii Nc14]|eukprot:CCA24065.1 serine protease family S08A putative [Albugo laibachii Nc14]
MRLFSVALLWVNAFGISNSETVCDSLIVSLWPCVETFKIGPLPWMASARREYVCRYLSKQIEESQKHVISYLNASIVESVSDLEVVIEPLWIQNVVLVNVVGFDEKSNASSEMAEFVSDSDFRGFRNSVVRQFLDGIMSSLLHFPGVLDVEYDRRLSGIHATSFDQFDRMDAGTKSYVGSNIRSLHAPELWNLGVTGQNVTVASIDSGVRYSHETLRDTFRGKYDTARKKYDLDYAFWVPKGTPEEQLDPENADLVGHGTHTMGTAVGRFGIGVAPNASWITARAFDIYGTVRKSDFLTATQWIVCPTKLDGTEPNCHLGADIVTNSFGISRDDAAFKDWVWFGNVLDVWKAAGVIAVFASGNTNGFQCGSVLFPASTHETIAVGALVGSKTLWGASGKGPGDKEHCSQQQLIKPDFVAPGVGIRSAISTSDDAFTRLSGTSMATPHVAGSIALMLSLIRSHPSSTYDSQGIIIVLKNTSAQTFSRPFLVRTKCGNISYRHYPNNIYGWGMPNVCNAANMLGGNCSLEILAVKSLQ